jgi:sporulation protein YlmC with PRC-barrel domain
VSGEGNRAPTPRMSGLSPVSELLWRFKAGADACGVEVALQMARTFKEMPRGQSSGRGMIACPPLPEKKRTGAPFHERGEEDVRRMRICLPSLAIAMLSLFLQAASCAQEGAQGGHPAAATEPSLQVMRAQRIIDTAVQNQRGEHLGEIEDVVIDTADGRIAYVAMDAGLLGPILAVPWKALGMTQDKSTVTLDVAKEALQKAPTFRREHWPETVDPDWLAGVYNYYGYPPYPGLTEVTVQHKRVARVTTLLGLNVRNRQRESLGEIGDFMIDMREGHIAYVLLGTEGVLGVGERVRYYGALPYWEVGN